MPPASPIEWSPTGVPGLQCARPVETELLQLLPKERLERFAELVREFAPRLEALRVRRGEDAPRAADADDAPQAAGRGASPTPHIELTGPPRRGALRAAETCGADLFTADFANGLVPRWEDVHAAHALLHEACRQSSDVALGLAPRDWMSDEDRVQVDGRPVPAVLFDLIVFLGGATSARRVCLTLPDVDHPFEARLLRELVEACESAGPLAPGSVTLRLAVASLGAAEQLESITEELGERLEAVLPCPVAFLASLARSLPRGPSLPGRPSLLHGEGPLLALRERVVRVCRLRGVSPVSTGLRNLPTADPDGRTGQLALVERELREGFDGCRVPHPDWVAPARELLAGERETAETPDAPLEGLLDVGERGLSETGLRDAVRTGLLQLAHWLDGHAVVRSGARPLCIATTELSRCLLWQWIESGALLDDGRVVDVRLVGRLIDEERRALRGQPIAAGLSVLAVEAGTELFEWLSTAPQLEPSLPASAARDLRETSRAPRRAG